MGFRSSGAVSITLNSRAPVKAYNSNGLWLKEPAAAAAAEALELRDEGGFKGLKLRLGR